MPSTSSALSVRHLTLGFDGQVLLEDLSFEVRPGAVFVIMGGSGCGKSTLLRHLVGLQEPMQGAVFHGDVNFTEAPESLRATLRRRMGVLFQHGALWSSMTLAENVGLVLEEFTDLPPSEVRALASLKLALVGLRGFEDHYPHEVSGGMQRRAGLARAMALDPAILFCDEPSAGLDPVSSRRLDDLIRELRDSLGTTVVLVTHEVDSILAIGTDSIFLDPESRSIVARGHPRDLYQHATHPDVWRFLHRGDAPPGAGA